MSDLLAKCDWHGDELRVELPQWPEVVTVWVGGKAEPFVPVTDPDALGAIKCLQCLADANAERCDTCEAMLDCDECVKADASHKELRGLQAENDRLRDQLEEQKCFAADLERDVKALRELVRDMADYGEGAGSGMAEWFVDRMRELGVEQ